MIKKNFIIIIIFTFFLQSILKANETNTFQIEGISIGDNLLDHFTLEHINSFDKEYIKDKLIHNYGDKSKDFLIKSTRLKLKKFDDLNIKDEICFIKIDVEGLDHLVLFGMKKCIKKFLPVILVEYNFNNFSKIYDFLNRYYNCFFYDFKKFKLFE